MQKGLTKDCVGANCMVFSKQNKLLFLGVVGYFDEVNHSLRVNWTDQCPVRSAMDCGDIVKLKISWGANANQFILVDALVEQIINHYMVVTPKSVLEKNEEREYFRQPVMEPSVISFVNRRAAGDPCMIVDVSATGISIQSNAIYENGDVLWMFNQPIFSGGTPHNLEFVVVRKNTVTDGAYRNFYGCKFINMSAEAQDKLCGEIFTLQSTSLRSMRDR